MAEFEFDPTTGLCMCVACHEARHDMALMDVRDAKIALADAYIEADETLDVALTAGQFDKEWPVYLSALRKRDASVKEVKRLQGIANAALDALIARKHAANGERNG